MMFCCHQRCKEASGTFYTEQVGPSCPCIFARNTQTHGGLLCWQSDCCAQWTRLLPWQFQARAGRHSIQHGLPSGWLTSWQTQTLIWVCMQITRSLPWRPAATTKRQTEQVRPIFWSNRPRAYLKRTSDWDSYPAGRWGNAASPAYGTQPACANTIRDAHCAAYMAEVSTHDALLP